MINSALYLGYGIQTNIKKRGFDVKPLIYQ